MYKRAITILFGFIASGFAMAVEQCASWGCTSTVSEIYTNVNGYIYVATPLDETKANCKVYPGNYFVLKPEAQNIKEVYSSLLAAYVANEKIQIRIIENSPICEIAYVRLSKNH